MEFEYVIVELTANGDIDGLGAHSFKAPLHKGDYIIMDNKGQESEYPGGKAYEVLLIKLAPMSFGAPAVGDALVRFAGSESELNQWQK